MGLRVGSFVVAFNALWWVSRAGLGPWAALHGGAPMAWVLTLLAPLCLLGLVVRVRALPARPACLVAGICLSVGALLVR